MNAVSRIFSRYSARARAFRAGLFRQKFDIGRETRILDLGSEDGSNIASVLGGTNFLPANVYIADIDSDAIERGRANYGFKPVLLGEDGLLPFEYRFFDIVYCSSVLEHVTSRKSDIWQITSGSEFRTVAHAAQERLAKEVTRVGMRYFVQTPCRSFPIESHSWLPVVGMLPREFIVPLFKLTNRIWVKKTIPDFYLLSKTELQRLFPHAEIIEERSFGFTKSLMAIGR